MIEQNRSVITTRDDVLDPRPEAAGNVEPRLHAEGHARLQRQLVPGHDVGLLMRFEPDAVARAVNEELAEAGTDQGVAGQAIDSLAGDSGPHARHSQLLGVEKCGVGVAVLRPGIPQGICARLVAAVAVRHRSPDIHDHRVAALQHAIRHLVMRAGPIRPGGDDDEIDGGVAFSHDQLGDIAPHLSLRAPRAKKGGHLGVYAIDRVTSPRQGFDLVRRLAHAKRVEHLACEALLDCGHRLPEREYLGRPHVVVDADHMRAAHDVGNEGEGIVRLPPCANGDVEVADRTSFGSRLLEDGCHEDGICARAHHEAGESLERNRVVTREISQVGAGRHQQGIQAAVERSLGGRRESTGKIGGRNHAATLPGLEARRRGRHDGPVLLLDSASLYYRSYFALPETIVAPNGQPVNAVRGFLDTVAALVRDRGSSDVIACWDEDWRPQWRVDLIPTYKTHRVLDDGEGEEETPDTLSPQIDILRELLPALGVPIVGEPGFEADDVIAGLARSVPGPVDIASGDRDLVQLVTDRVTLLFTGGTSASRGGRPWEVITPDVAESRFGVPPSVYADLAVLRGDPSDGLPGVRGIGEKTAAALIRAFGDLEGVMSAAHDPASSRPMTPAVRARLLDSEQEVHAAARVVRLDQRGIGPRLPSTVRPSPQADDLAAAYGVGASARRLLDALT